MSQNTRRNGALLDIDAALFDMDGTLIDSHYDWPAIRRELDLNDAPSLIDALDALPSPERERRWARMRAIEDAATEHASLRPGVRRLLDFLARRGVATALVTNNSAACCAKVRERYDLSFDLVLTRDDGFWKPSSAPLAEALRRLKVSPPRAIKVGDSHFDVAAGRAAGCHAVVILGPQAEELRVQADLAFAEPIELLAHLRSLV